MKPAASRLLTLALALATVPAATALATPGESRRGAAHLGELVVRMKDGSGAIAEQRALGRAGVRVRQRAALRAEGRSRSELLRVDAGPDLAAAMDALAADPDVELVEPNWRIWPAAVSNDTNYVNGRLWGVFSADSASVAGPAGTTNAYGTGAEQAWQAGKTGSRQVYVGVLDEGIAFDHPDLGANVWTNPFDPPNGRDDDGNRYVDDVHGWDFHGGDASVYDGGSTGSEDRHGTHVAGTIGALGGNAAGVAGMAWQVSIVPAKILGPDGGSTYEATLAVDYLVDLKTRHGLDVVAINNSWSSGGYSRSLHDAVIRAAKQGILMICAAGNDAADNDTTAVYPANFDTTQGTASQSAATWDSVVAVAALDRFGALASFSDYGASRVDIAAPGVSIWSTLPPATYGAYSGTSMAAPHVTGAAALYKSAHPGATGPEIRAALLGNAVATPSLAGKVATGGRLDVSGSAFTGATHVPDVAVTSVMVPSVSTQGTSYIVQVTVTNQGTQPATFTVALADVPPSGGVGGSLTAPRVLTVAPGTVRQAGFTWNTRGATPGTHQLRATVSTLAGETDASDNVRSASSTVRLPVPAAVGAVVRRATTLSSGGLAGSPIDGFTIRR